MKIIDRKHLRTFITLRDQKIMKFLCLVLNFWPRLYVYKTCAHVRCGSFQFLRDWLTYAVDNIKAVESLDAFEICLDFMSLNAMKCDTGSIFVRFLQ